MSGNIWGGIRNNLSGLRTGIVNTFSSIPDYAYRGMQVWGHNNKLVEDLARNPTRMSEAELRSAYKRLKPQLPGTALDAEFPEQNSWLKSVDVNGSPERPDVYRDNPALYYYDTAAAYAGRYPWQIGAGVVGGYAADQWLNKPVEGLVDTLTFNALNLRPDERTQQSDVFYPAVPTLTAEDLAYQIKRQQGNMAITALTLQQLQRLQQLQSGQAIQQLQPIEYGY